MVQNIVDVVESKCADGFQSEFGNGIRDNSWSFQQALSFITDYIRRYRIIVPNNLREAVLRLKTGHHPTMNTNKNMSRSNNNLILPTNVHNYYANEDYFH